MAESEEDQIRRIIDLLDEREESKGLTPKEKAVLRYAQSRLRHLERIELDDLFDEDDD